ncbi:MAG: 50S ribosomal protein L13 [Gemmatimonadetes bacterium]|nr:50S ribosomal protein L13 [Gemmatimonadota bacterium]
MKTHITKASEIHRNWHVVDAQGLVLGRLASEVAILLRGKHKPNYSTHLDVGDNVVIVNAGDVILSGRKMDQKMMRRHSLYPGGMKATPYREWMEKQPTEAVRKAIRGMLPKTKLGRQMLTKVKIYADAEHPHVAQNPIPYEVKSSRPPRAAEASQE